MQLAVIACCQYDPNCFHILLGAFLSSFLNFKRSFFIL